ncbi:MAG: hypothetical protein J3K34DRAFT_424308 [Monoraphidium minutum]|nr:MAG: hypothetical protein J3K34DRAFT_424308 [Monoraphidium minutum]
MRPLAMLLLLLLPMRLPMRLRRRPAGRMQAREAVWRIQRARLPGLVRGAEPRALNKPGLRAAPQQAGGGSLCTRPAAWMPHSACTCGRWRHCAAPVPSGVAAATSVARVSARARCAAAMRSGAPARARSPLPCSLADRRSTAAS